VANILIDLQPTVLQSRVAEPPFLFVDVHEFLDELRARLVVGAVFVQSRPEFVVEFDRLYHTYSGLCKSLHT